MKRVAVAVALLLLAAPTFAQMHQPGMPPSTPGTGMSGTEMGNMGPMHMAVATDGTVVVIERTLNSANTTVSSAIVAYSASGAKAWSYPLDANGAMEIEVAGNLVVFGSARGASASTAGTLTALQLSNGQKAWSLTLDGFAMAIEPAANQLYVIVVKPGAQQNTTSSRFGMTYGPATRTLNAVTFGGVVSWSKPLG